ncbi:MAG: hypothetical protein L6Q35_00525 [Phycisphaerales bacterium]|nr:hypothetical protein [Phycisphaerales bacterium]
MIDAWQDTRNRRGPKGYGPHPCWRASYEFTQGDRSALAVENGETCLEAVAGALACAAEHAKGAEAA